MPTKCAECGTDFEQKKHGKRASYCSTPCRERARSKRPERRAAQKQYQDTRRTPKVPYPTACGVCSTPLQKKNFGRHRLYCSTSCLEKARHARNRDDRIARMKTYNAANHEEQTAKKRAHYNANKERINETDRTRWTGERKEEGNMKRGQNFQKERLHSPWKSLLHAAAYRAKIKKVPFELTDAWVETNWTGRCSLTGIEFGLGQRSSGPKIFSASIDRIKPWKGYVPGNCRFVIWAVNALKHDGDDDDMYLVAEALVKNRVKSDS